MLTLNAEFYKTSNFKMNSNTSHRLLVDFITILSSFVLFYVQSGRLFFTIELHSRLRSVHVFTFFLTYILLIHG